VRPEPPSVEELLETVNTLIELTKHQMERD
jgi:hypothetical protein